MFKVSLQSKDLSLGSVFYANQTIQNRNDKVVSLFYVIKNELQKY